MLKNYIKVALRNIVKHRTFSFINIFGLAVAMTICMAIIMLVADQMMLDRHNPAADKIYRVTTIPYWKDSNGLAGTETASTSLPLRDELLTKYTSISKGVRLLRGFGNSWLAVEPGQDVNIPVSGYFTDAEFLQMFNHELLYGDITTALVEPYSVVLTKKAAEKLFQKENPVGETLKVGKLGIYTVTGVIKETENRSHIVVEAYASMSTVKSLETAGILESVLDNWNNPFQGWLYVQVADGKTMADVQADLEKISMDHFGAIRTEETVLKFSLQHLLDIVPGPLLNNPIGPFLPWAFVYFFMAIAGIILITSCFNFTNLSIARSLTRAKEIGVRKVTGAMRWQLFTQFLSESVVIALLALVLSVGMIYALRPFIVDLAFARLLKWDLSANYLVYIVFFVFAAGVGTLAGLFPAGVLSGFQPIKVLKSMGNTRLMSKVGLRKALLVVQFSVSMIFILTVIVLYNQVNLFIHHDNGFSVSQKLVIYKGNTSFEVLKPELEKQANIKNVSAASHIPMAGMVKGNDMKRPGDESWRNLLYYAVDAAYLENMNLTLVAGRFFDASAGESNKSFIVINEEAVRAYQFGSALDAIGQSLILRSDSTEKVVIGVVKDYYHELFADRLRPLSLTYTPEELTLLQIAYTGTFEDARATTEKVWAGINPGLKVEVKDFQKEMGEIYDIIFGTLLKVLGFVAVLAITISCLGLLGMATYTIQTRKKEIAMRKVLGSSNRSLIMVLSRGYIGILIISVAIAVPLAYMLNTFWLQQFANHVSVDVFTIATGVFVLIVFGGITIGSQTIQATFVKPVESLKNE